jgi:poly(A) polymerase
VFEQRIGDVSGRGKLAADMREIWVMQPRFEKRTGNTRKHGGAACAFRAGFDFMRLRADVGEVDEALADWWQEFQHADEFRREDLMEQAREEQKSRSAPHRHQRAMRPARGAPRAHPRDGGRRRPPLNAGMRLGGVRISDANSYGKCSCLRFIHKR